MIQITEEEEKEIIRVCGPHYTSNDIPAYMRKERKPWESLEEWAEWHGEI